MRNDTSGVEGDILGGIHNIDVHLFFPRQDIT
jgi:hypothetical protein